MSIDLILEKYLNEVKVVIKKPSECTKSEKDDFISLVLSGGQNNPNYVKNSFSELVWVGLLYVGNEVKSVSAIKHGRNIDIFKKAGVKSEANKYPYEVGFSYTDEDSRGMGYNKRLKVELFNKIGSKGIYCTIRTNNTESMIVNKKLGFEPLGIPYMGIVTTVQLMVRK